MSVMEGPASRNTVRCLGVHVLYIKCIKYMMNRKSGAVVAYWFVSGSK